MIRAAAVTIIMIGLLWNSQVSAAGEGEKCGGLPGILCDQNLWCDPEPGMCKGADIAGIASRCQKFARKMSFLSAGVTIRTYPNDCNRQAAKVGKKSDQACADEKK